MLRAILVFAILIPGVLLALTSRFYALLLYVWFAFFRPQEWVWINLRSLRLSLILAVLLVLPAIFTSVFPNLTHPMSIAIVMFWLSGLLAQMNAVDPAMGWRFLDVHGSWSVVLLFAISIIKTPKQMMQVVAVAAGCLGFFGAKAGIVSLLAGGAQFNEGLAGAFLDNNAFAVGLVMTIPLLIALGQNAELTFPSLPAPTLRWVKLGLYIAAPLCFYTVISTFSRGGFLGAVAAALTWAIFHPRRFRLLILFAFLGSLLWVVPLPEGYEERISSISELSEDVETANEDVTEGRFYFWGVALSMAADHPFGIGMRNFMAQFGNYDKRGAYGRRRDVHSSHFQVVAEHGIIGTIVWVGMFTYSLVLARRVRRRSRTPGLDPLDAKLMETVPLAFVVSMSGFLIGGATVSMALNDLTWLTFALFASLDILSKQKCAEAALAAASAPSGPSAEGEARRPSVGFGNGRETSRPSHFPPLPRTESGPGGGFAK
jgi:putative inorganic carbon (HCO3(-)) transporter